jgi:hypothetical protein
MAALAASFTCCGVSKSGSPCDKPMMSRPCRRNSFAVRVIEIVGDGATDDMRLDSRTVASAFETVELLWEDIVLISPDDPRRHRRLDRCADNGEIVGITKYGFSRFQK